MDKIPEEIANLGINYFEKKLPFEVRTLAFWNLNDDERNQVIRHLTKEDLPNLSEAELFYLMKTLRTGDRGLKKGIAEKVANEYKAGKIKDESAMQIRIAALYLDGLGYALKSDLEIPGNKQLFDALGQKGYATMHPVPNYLGDEAPVHVLIRNSSNLKPEVEGYVATLKEKTKPAGKSIQSGTPKIITLQQATEAMMDKYKIESVRPAMVQALVGIAYAGSVPMGNSKQLQEMGLIEFSNSDWQRVFPEGIEHKLSGPVYALNVLGVGSQLSQIRHGQLAAKLK